MKCLFNWFSGFFAAPAIASGLLIFYKMPLVIGEHELATSHAILIAGLGGILAVLLAFSGCRCGRQ